MRYRLDRFYDNVQIAAGRRNMSLQKLMPQVGISWNRRYELKAGEEPTLLEVICICEFLGCDIEDLLK